MSRTITAWAVVHPDGMVGPVYQSQDSANAYASTHGATVIELTGELPDPPKTVTVDGLTWTEETCEWNTPSGQWCTITSRTGRLLDRIWELEQQIGGAS